ncbi:MAG: NAD(P)-dependent oxidoreductase [Paraburkholderia sp.]|uniref:NAD(P)-dependent oxidoreductase n=1 Tax=Paraburkholderia sp. TaxID=1926495 RepID=UPI00121464FF|nr:NAD(P)H-binding protein [Paraburkholderia sp.]TAM03355.1 MAG: NAD(P)-dependent oxidoreductase [Paraburkholderia sp.]TAM29211.1 MAG: NAD(P)-dependent oxidoreductase [Paraburkholderia sp.]
MSRIAIIGGTGNVGQRIAVEAQSRGHQVTVVARKPSAAIPFGANFVAGDAVTGAAALGEKLKGHDVLVSAAKFASVTAANVLEVARGAGIGRVLVVGGAGSLEIKPGLRLVDTPDFPEAYKSEAVPGAQFLDDLRKVHDVDWTFLTPAAHFVPGLRTGTFRLGGDAFFTDDKGNSMISYEDYAIAMLDEIEKPANVRKRFSIAY